MPVRPKAKLWHTRLDDGEIQNIDIDIGQTTRNKKSPDSEEQGLNVSYIIKQ